MSDRLDGKIAVITGGTSGIGLATAKLVAAEGAHVFITGRRLETLKAAEAEIGGNVTGIQAKSSNPADLDRLYEQVRTRRVASTCCTPMPEVARCCRSARSPKSISMTSSAGFRTMRQAPAPRPENGCGRCAFAGQSHCDRPTRAPDTAPHRARAASRTCAHIPD
jgi:NAD(P)-dependent dehydrogenase (short-subunit alcohol dehydrogenase family)